MGRLVQCAAYVCAAKAAHLIRSRCEAVALDYVQSTGGVTADKGHGTCARSTAELGRDVDNTQRRTNWGRLEQRAKLRDSSQNGLPF